MFGVSPLQQVSCVHKQLVGTGSMTEVMGFVGLGAMGLGMACNLQKLLRSHAAPPSLKSRDLYVYNRTAAKAIPLTNDPNIASKLLEDPSQLAPTCTIICMMLADDAACGQIIQELCKSELAGKLVINHSTSTVEFARAAERQVAGRGGIYLAANVWGRPDVASAGQLKVVPGGPAAAIERARPFLEAFGTLLPTQDAAYKANAFKLAGNFMLYSFVEAMAEGMTLAGKSGISRQHILAFVNAFFPAPSLQGYATRMTYDEFDAKQGAAVDIGIKDLRYARQLAESTRCPLPSADTVFNSLLSASADGHGSKDLSCMVLAVQQAAGVSQCKSE